MNMLNEDFYGTIQKDIDSFLDSFLERETPDYSTDRRSFRHDWYAYQDEYAYNFCG